MKLHNKTIIITGGSTGVAKALIVECMVQGANIVFGDNNELVAQELIENIQGQYRNKIFFVRIDLQNVNDCELLFKKAIEKFSKIDGFVNYAGITPVSGLLDCNEYTYDKIFDINLKAAFFCCQFAIANMIKNEGGSIILVGSSHAWSGQEDRAAYAISKGALLTLSEHISHNYAKNKIRCNYFTMGWTPTEGELSFRKEIGMSNEELLALGASILPMGRMLNYDDYIPGLIYLLSDDSSMVTGSNLRITAGEYI
jgi:NAD(P)-dependent dehydrogenase (short-subunit alcohol dehydrogenase family)